MSIASQYEKQEQKTLENNKKEVYASFFEYLKESDSIHNTHIEFCWIEKGWRIEKKVNDEKIYPFGEKYMDGSVLIKQMDAATNLAISMNG